MKLKIPKLQKHKIKKLKIKFKKKKKKNIPRKKSIQKKKKYPKIPRIPRISRVDGRLTRSKDYTALFYFVFGSVLVIILILQALGLI